MVVGFPLDLNPVNVRHAHSHLMYFSWVTPALMLLIGSALPRATGRELSHSSRRTLAWTCVSAIVLGLMAFVPFLAYGYTSAEIGGRSLPLSMIFAGLNVIPWYVFTAWYVRRRWDSRRSPVLTLFDGAVGFLVLASAGAWLLAAVSMSGATSLFLERASLHIFLDYFAEGWLVLGLLGMMHLHLDRPVPRWIPFGTAILLIGLTAIFLLALPSSVVPSALRSVASVGGAMVAVGTLLHVGALWSLPSNWRPVLVLLALKAIGTGAYAMPIVGEWLASQGLRLLYLHLLLLGVVTLALLQASSSAWFSDRLRGINVMTVFVVILLVSLVPLTNLWPAALSGRWVLIAAAVISVLPLLAATRILAASTTRQNPKRRLTAA